MVWNKEQIKKAIDILSLEFQNNLKTESETWAMSQILTSLGYLKVLYQYLEKDQNGK